MNVVPSLRGKHSARYLRNPFHAHVLPALELPIHLTNEVFEIPFRWYFLLFRC